MFSWIIEINNIQKAHKDGADDDNNDEQSLGNYNFL